MFESLCKLCKHRQGLSCTAFPEGIPVEIREMYVDHRHAYAGDRGIRFEPKDETEETQRRLAKVHVRKGRVPAGENELDRRVSKVIRTLRFEDAGQKSRFTRCVQSANRFEDLPDWCQTLVLEAEARQGERANESGSVTVKVTIFYSWQSDLPNGTNWGFIQRALEKAIKSIKADAETVLEPCIERDTAGVPGSPDIASTIFRKIDACQVFVGDVSIVNPTSSDRKTPNPNVLLELGYAAKTLTWENVICVCNTACGKVEELPFDLRLRRVCTYALTEDQADKGEVRDTLVSKLKAALVPILKRFEVMVQEDAAPKPLTHEAATQKVKEYLADDKHRIQLTDLVMGQGNELAAKIAGPDFPASVPSRGDVEALAIFKERISRYEEITQVGLAMLVAGCYFGAGTPTHDKLWVDLLQRVANPAGQQSGLEHLLKLRRYPALLLLYGGGIAALAGEHYGTLLALLTRPKLVNERRGGDDPSLDRLSPHVVLAKVNANAVWGQERHTPVSDHLFEVLRGHFQVLLPDERSYEKCFDRFEYLWSLLEVDVLGDVRSVGRYAWRWRWRPDEYDVRREVEAEERQVGRNWQPYRAGWFSGQRERFAAAKQKVDAAVAGLRW
jgi:hypothetical protein